MAPPPFPDRRGAPPYHLMDMIQAQPGAVRRALQINSLTLGPVASRLLAAKRVYLAACGTSFHACQVGEFALRWALPSSIAVTSLQAFEFRAYPPPLGPDCVVISPTHSGETKATNEALALATRAGAHTIVITMAPDSSAARFGRDVLLQGKERDRSWVNTLSYTTQLALLLRLAFVAGRQAGMAGLDELDFGLNAMPEALKQVLRLEPQLQALAQEFAPRDRFLFVGGGPNVPTALEAALKMKEATYTAAEGWEVEQLIHGPIFSFDGRYAAFILLPPGPSRLRTLAVLRALRKAGVHAVALGEEGDQEAEGSADAWVPLPPVAELLSPIPYIVPLQLVTYHSAVARGINPDALRTEDSRYGPAASLLFER